jgi:hypothetical protein
MAALGELISSSSEFRREKDDFSQLIRGPPMVIFPPEPPPIIATVDIKRVDMKDPKEFVDQAWGYVWPAMLTYASGAISFKILILFLKAGKGE